MTELTERNQGADFCPDCGVVMDLHDGPDTCLSARMRADLLTQFGAILR